MQSEVFQLGLRSAQANFDMAFNVTSLNEDNLVNVIFQTEQAFSLKQVHQDPSLADCLKARRVQARQPKNVLVVPVSWNGSLTGSLEIYASLGDQNEQSQLATKEGVDYWLFIFERFAASLGQGMHHFMTQLVNKLSMHTAMVQNELSFELGTFLPNMLSGL